MPANFQNAIIGQTKLINRINSFTIDSLPHSILMIGDLGCGKHTLCKYIADKFGLEISILKRQKTKNITVNTIAINRHVHILYVLFFRMVGF